MANKLIVVVTLVACLSIHLCQTAYPNPFVVPPSDLPPVGSPFAYSWVKSTPTTLYPNASSAASSSSSSSSALPSPLPSASPSASSSSIGPLASQPATTFVLTQGGYQAVTMTSPNQYTPATVVIGTSPNSQLPSHAYHSSPPGHSSPNSITGDSYSIITTNTYSTAPHPPHPPPPRATLDPLTQSSQSASPSSRYSQCPIGSTCVNLFECTNQRFSSMAPCEMYSTGTHGVCCQDKLVIKTSNEASYLRPLTSSETMMESTFPFITMKDLIEASEKARQDMINLMRLERELERRGLVTGRQTTEEHHHRFFSNEKEANNHSFDGLITMRAGIELIRKFQLNPKASKNGLRRISFSNTILGSHCKQDVVSCQMSKYRTHDGSCNNLNNVIWGKSFQPFNRLLSPDYGDGIDSPRLSSRGTQLPNPRILSFTLSPETKSLSKYFTHVLMQWGQFMDHDMTRTAISRTFNGRGISCCNREFERNPKLLHPACLPIDVPVDDPFYSKFDSTCMSFVRSAPAPSTMCTIGPREQLNQDTPFLDGGQVYGSTEESANDLRTFEGGKMRVSIVDGREFLPQTDTIENCNIPPDSGLKCFLAGDNRVNMQVSLVTVQAMFLRHHNRLTDQLAKLNPSWSDEQLYQEARRIIGAQIQHISYNEYLPLIIGKRVMEAFDLSLSDGPVDLYDPNVNPQILSAFSSAAFRLHTTIRATIPFRDEANRVIGQLDLSDTFLNPSIVYTEDSYPEMLNGLAGASMTKFDRFFTTEVTHHLFRRFNASFGIDLVAVNIQRGRDHGIPPYNVWRHVCGLPVLHTFDDLHAIMDADAAAKIASLYESVDDIDLFVGGNCEYHIKGAIVGPTFACIIAEQFRRLKVGDRFWYENSNQIGSFSPHQLAEIKKTTLASIFCGDEVTHMQKLAFIRPFEQWNPRLPCSQIPRMDLSPWYDDGRGTYWKKK